MPRFRMPALLLSCAYLLSLGAAHAATFTVTNNADGGLGSLRAAINLANGALGADTVKFAIPGTGPFTITLTSPLPTVTSPLTIDGYTQSGSSTNTLIEGTNAVLMIEITTTGGNALLFDAGSDGSTMRGIDFTGCATAVSADNSGNHRFSGNLFSLCDDAIVIRSNAVDVTVGGISRADCNLVSTCDNGISVVGADGTVIQGNLIGTDAAGTAAAGNIDGIRLVNATNTLVGGIAKNAGNVISGNTGFGINDGATGNLTGGNRIEGNRIGTDAAGTSAVANGVGIRILDISGETVGGPDALQRNIISGSTGVGLLVNGATEDTFDTLVQNNFIGTDVSGLAALPNGNGGVRITGSLAADNTVQGNLISGNTGNGLSVESAADGTVITHNLIGGDITGLAALPNSQFGVLLTGDTGTILGGNGAEDTNMISGNGEHGVVLGTGTGNILGNLIGTDISGQAPLPNQQNGITVVNARFGILGSTAGGRNVVSGNAGHGISVENADGVGLLILNNAIGTGPQGVLDVGNGGSGIHVSDTAPTGLAIGGDLGGQRNFIGFNAGDGITVTGGTSAGIEWYGNLIFGNGGIGIDLGDDGATSNDGAGDADAGPNGLQNFPDLATLEAGTSASLTYTLATTASGQFTVEFFAITSSNRMRFLARQTGVTTDGTGNRGSTPATLGPVGLDETVVAVLIDETTGNSSEISPEISPTNASVFDAGLYVKKGKFTINFAKHDQNQSADSLSFSGNINPAGIEDTFSGVQITVLVNDQTLIDDALDASGNNKNLPLNDGTYSFSIKPSNGQYSFSAKKQDLRELLDVADADAVGTVEVTFGMRFTGSSLLTSQFINVFQFQLKSALRKTASGSFSFTKDATSGGAFLILKSSATEKDPTPLHTLKLTGVVSAGDLDLTPAGNIDIDIGSSGTITLTPADYTIKDDGPLSIITMNKGAVPELAKFQINNAKHTFSITTNNIGAGLDAAGAGATANIIAVTLVWDTASGNTITFEQQLELKRTDIDSGKWKR
ncbi:MAG: hypothetical protein L6R28_15310 [Planctomycetes bacterium]|nr:hypothetical protein [Planctomycetota bacterium]